MPPASAKKVNERLIQIFGRKPWIKDLDFTGANPKALEAMTKLLNEAELWKSQVDGLEKELRRLR